MSDSGSNNVLDYLNCGDKFCQANHIRVTLARPGYAEAELLVSENSLNAGGVVQGGAIFTLADLAFAACANAANPPEIRTVTMSANIVMLRPGTGSRLLAKATEISRGSRTGLYDVKVYDEENHLVAQMQSTGFHIAVK